MQKQVLEKERFGRDRVIENQLLSLRTIVRWSEQTGLERIVRIVIKPLHQNYRTRFTELMIKPSPHCPHLHPKPLYTELMQIYSTGKKVKKARQRPWTLRIPYLNQKKGPDLWRWGSDDSGIDSDGAMDIDCLVNHFQGTLKPGFL